MDNKYFIDESMKARLDNSFTYHSPKDDQPERYKLLRNQAKEFALLIIANTPAGREQSVAITRLEEVVMWANKAIACGE